MSYITNTLPYTHTMRLPLRFQILTKYIKKNIFILFSNPYHIHTQGGFSLRCRGSLFVCYMSRRAAAFFPNDVRPIKWETTLSDFESGLLPAIRDHDYLAPPQIAVRGCHFHHTECIWRQIQREGLSREYRVVEGVKNFVKGLFAIPFLPPHEVEQGYFEFIERHRDV